MTGLRRLCVFCGARGGDAPAYRQAARELGTLMGGEGIGLVYGGATIGLMGELADAVISAGGEVIGVITESLASKEIAHAGVSELHVVGSMHERKALMAGLSDGFLALPGGLGTLEELFEILRWAQLGIHTKACVVLNVNHYYDPLAALLEHAVRERFVDAHHRDILVMSADSRQALTLLAVWTPPREWEPATSQAPAAIDYEEHRIGKRLDFALSPPSSPVTVNGSGLRPRVARADVRV